MIEGLAPLSPFGEKIGYFCATLADRAHRDRLAGEGDQFDGVAIRIGQKYAAPTDPIEMRDFLGGAKHNEMGNRLFLLGEFERKRRMMQRRRRARYWRKPMRMDVAWICPPVKKRQHAVRPPVPAPRSKITISL